MTNGRKKQDGRILPSRVSREGGVEQGAYPVLGHPFDQLLLIELPSFRRHEYVQVQLRHLPDLFFGYRHTRRDVRVRKQT